MKSIIFTLMLLALACIALPVARDQEINSLISNATNAEFSQEVIITASIPIELTPIATPTIIQTPIVMPTKQIIIVKATPKPTPLVTPTVIITTTPKVSWTKEQVIARIKVVFGSNADKAINIGMCESGLNPLRQSGVDSNPSSYGIFQIRALKGRGTIDQLLDAEYNIQLAYRMSGGGNTWAKGWVNCAKKYGYS